MAILAAVDGKPEHDRVVEVGHDLATAYDDELVVLHVMEDKQFEELNRDSETSGPVVVPGVDEASGIAYVGTDGSTADYTLEDAVEDAARVAQECISRRLTEQNQEIITTEGRVGDPASSILEEADRIDARFVVVGGRKRSPTGKAIFGSVSQSVILNADRPVVTITAKEE